MSIMVGEFNAAGTAEKQGMRQIRQTAHELIEPTQPVREANKNCRKSHILQQMLCPFSLAVLLPLILVLVACNEDTLPVDWSGQAPIISLRVPLEGASVEMADLLVEGSVSNTAESVEVTVALDATYTVSASGHPDFSATIPAAELSLGAHTITATAADADGLTALATVHITVVDAQTTGDTGTLTIYPATQAIEEQFESDRFAVRLSQNGSTQTSFVYQSDNDADPNWSGTLDYMQTANHWTTFSFDGSVDVEVSRLDGNTIQSCFVRPLALNIQTRTEGNRCYFTLDHPVKVSVEIDENTSVSGNFNQIGAITKQIVKHPLFVFADPLETTPPQATDPGVLYFGPGIHNIGKEYPLANNTQVYIAGGAYVIGTFISAQSNPNNIAIRGRGILSGIELTETAAENTQWRNHAINFSNGSNGSGLMIEGITITDPLRSCIISYSPVTIQHVKLFSWNHRNDGIVAGNNSLVEDSFIKVQDDNIKLYYSHQIIRRNVIWQQTSGGVFKFAWNLSGTAQDNQVSDIDLIHSDVFNDYAAGEQDRSDMHSTSAVFSAMGFKKGAAFQNNAFSRIRIEEENLLRLMSLRMVSSHSGPSGTTTWGDPDPAASKLIDELMFEDIQLAGVPYKQSTLYGNAGGTIRNLSFVNLSVNGTQVASADALSSRNDDIGLLTDGDVSNISFSPLDIPQTNSQYRGIPDPSTALGFDVRAEYTVSQVITGSQGTQTLSCTGTAAEPCLIDASDASFKQLTLNGEYVILQGGTVNAPADDGAHLYLGCTHCVVRDVEVSGPGGDTGHSSAVHMNDYSVWIGGSIHGFGDNRVTAAEQDFHGMKIMVNDVWILEAEIYDCSGDSIQVGDASRGSASRVYIGGGYFHHNRENGVDIKDSTGVVVSGVHMEGFRPTSSSPGEAFIVHDDAYNARVYDNVIRDSTMGMVSSGRSGHIIDGNDIVALSKGIQIRNTQNITVTNNTVSAPTPIDLQSGVTGTVQDQ